MMMMMMIIIIIIIIIILSKPLSLYENRGTKRNTAYNYFIYK